MKRTKLTTWHLTLAGMLLLLLACKKEYEPPTSEPSHLFITTSFGDLYPNLIIYDTMSVIDLSRGVESRTWRFTEGGVDIVNSENDASSGESVVKFTFSEPGLQRVYLSQTYIDKVYIGAEQQATNTWDTSLVVAVFDSVHAAFTMDRELPWGEAINLADTLGALNEIMGGRNMLFTNESTGGAQALWMIYRNDIDFIYQETTNELLYKFTSLGDYSVALLAISDFDRDYVNYTDLVRVVPSTDPILLDSLLGVEDGAEGSDLLKMVFSRSMTEPEGILEGNQLSLYVSNEGTVYDVSITDAYLDEAQNNAIWLKLDGEIYNSDSVLLSYVPTTDSVLMTADSMNVPEISDMMASFFIPNLLEAQSIYDYNFENPSAQWITLDWGEEWTGGDIGVTTDVAYSGSRSLNVVLDYEAPKRGAVFVQSMDGTWNEDLSSAATFHLEDGRYEVGAWVYINSLGVPDSDPDTRDNFLAFFDPDVVVEIGLHLFEARAPLETWYYESMEVNFSEGNYFFFIRPFNGYNSDYLDFNIDDITVKRIEQR